MGGNRAVSTRSLASAVTALPRLGALIITRRKLELLTLVCCLGCCWPALAAETAMRWWEPYTGSEANGAHVLGLWKFDGEDWLKDESSHAHKTQARGAIWNAAGRFGGCLESSAGYPVIDESHGIQVAKSVALAPEGPFTVELWAKAKPADLFPAQLTPMLLDMKYVNDNHTGFSWRLTPAAADGSRKLSVEIGLGQRTERWYSNPLQLSTEAWTHLAFTYDGLGTIEFLVNGANFGGETKPSAGAMAAATRPLAIGDRLGSLYHGFPGYLDEVRISSGIRQLRPVDLIPQQSRFVFLRMAQQPTISFDLINRSGAALDGLKVSMQFPASGSRDLPVPRLEKEGRYRANVEVDSSLRPGEYAAKFLIEVAGWGGPEAVYRSMTTVPVVIVPRPTPNRMPVVMWGVNGTSNVVKELPRLKEIGFTHCLGLGVDYAKVWEEGAAALPDSPEKIREGREMLNEALENDFRIISTLAPARWLRTAKPGEPFRRLDREGKPYAREDVSGQFKEVQDFCYHTGLAMSRAYGDHPAYQASLLHTETRGESQVSFRDVDVAAYRQATGREIPEQVRIKQGVSYQHLPGFPEDRVIADDDPILSFLRWFWTVGDGWNLLHTRLDEGLKANLKSRDDFWTFYDPAVRVPSIGGSGGGVDVLSHWTYSYPDPIRIGLCADELFEMARAGGRGQDVMKMTQIIWYRSQTAPLKANADPPPSWLEDEPDAPFITIAPMHLREALWWKLARPIKGIMYHGWQSLVSTDSPSGYRYTNPETRKELKRLIDDVVVPLGPTLRQVPDAKPDVAFLQSFTSQMFARRGTYGWNQGWAGDLYHVLMYAQLQPRVLYEESLPAGLDGVKLLVMPDCDVLTKSIVETVRNFQSAGGLVVADAELCPAIKPDFVIERFDRSKTHADQDRVALLAAAEKLRKWLHGRYDWRLESRNPDVVTRLRQFGSTDYLFAVNDRREFGEYVGGYGRVMENGLPAETVVRLKRNGGHIYDLKRGTPVSGEMSAGAVTIPATLGPCEGELLMVTERPIQAVEIDAAEQVQRGASTTVTVSVTDGEKPIDAVIPLQIEIRDPEGRLAEFSGYYGAVGGRQTVQLDFARNDRLGVWEVRATELASRKSRRLFIRLVP